MNDFEAYKKYLLKANKIKLTTHFSLNEFIYSEKALHSKIDNRVYPSILMSNIQTLCLKVLEPVREYFGEPVEITSGFRCLELNKAIGSKDNSQHVKGQAADIVVKNTHNIEVFSYIKENLEFDQLIIEPNWIHVSYAAGRNRKQSLRFNGKVYSEVK